MTSSGPDDVDTDRRATATRLSLCVFGAPPDTGNLGVSALHHATVQGVLSRRPDARLVVFDNAYGHDATTLETGSGTLRFERSGARWSRRLHRPESYARLALASRSGIARNPGARALRAADAVLDISGGDSFSDLYGDRRFAAVLAPKRLALALGRPLVLLPQTYGPFATSRHRQVAQRTVRAARAAWARDVDSFYALQELLGSDYDPDRHRAGVDLAFALETREPDDLPAPLAALLDDPPRPLAGLNVSGLLTNDPTAAQRYGLQIDAAAVYSRVLEALVREGAHVVLVPHVLGAREESDTTACRALAASADPGIAAHVTVAAELRDPRAAKWLIARLDWFAGTRMHSTIAGLSSGVPTAALAYSLKTRGVFASCGQEDQVVDARTATTEEAVDALIASYRRRASIRDHLCARNGLVVEQAGGVLDEILEVCEAP